MAKRKPHYEQLAHTGGWIDFSDERIMGKLTKRQRYYVEEYERTFHAKLTEEDWEYYSNLPYELQEEKIYRQRKILSGRMYRQTQRTYFDNYETALKVHGETGLAALLRAVVRKQRGQLQREAIISDLPNLDLHYGRTGERAPNQVMINDSIGQASLVIFRAAREANIDIKEYFTGAELQAFEEAYGVDSLEDYIELEDNVDEDF